MAFFSWHGVDIAGVDRSGLQMARNISELKNKLFASDIALLSAKPCYPSGYGRINLSAKTELFNQLASLLNAGIYLDQAIKIIILQTKKGSALQLVLEDLLANVQTGMPFHQALTEHPTIFDPLASQVISAGHQSGNLSIAVESLATHYETSMIFRKELWQAISMPLITTSFFIFVALIILTVIMPTFSWLFASFNKELPRTTQFMLQIGVWIRAWGLLAVPLLATAIIIVRRFYMQHQRTKEIVLRIIWQLPLAGKISKYISIGKILESLALLTQGGVPLKRALETVQKTTTHPIVSIEIARQIESICHGISFSNTCAQRQDLFGPDIIAFIQTGEETGRLAPMLQRAAQKYQQQAAKLLKQFTTILQPALMIILGSWIALMIIAVYLPIFTLSHAIN